MRRHSGHSVNDRRRTCCSALRTWGSVQGSFLRGGKRPAQGEECVSRGAQGRVVVEAVPHAPFKIIEPHFLLEILVVTLDTPAQLRGADQLLE